MRLIDTYSRLHRHIAAWVDDEIDSLLVLGKPGNGKSHAYREALDTRPYHLFGGRQTPIHVYNALYDDPGLPVVLDDISSLLRDPNFIDMLKALCETGRKVVRWGTTTSKLEGRADSFVCASPVLIVLNKIPAHDRDIAAILDRCDAIEFEPTKTEIIARMRTIFPKDRGLIDLLAELPLVPTLRTLVKARRWERSKHLNLVEELFAECGVPRPVTTLVNIMESSEEDTWCQAYVEATGLTDRSYRRHKGLAEQLLDCRRSVGACPNVRVAKEADRDGQTDIALETAVEALCGVNVSPTASRAPAELSSINIGLDNSRIL